MKTFLQRSWRFSSITRWRQWLWYWHFWVGLWVCPLIIVLSLSGAVYLFKPQIDAWEASRIHQSLPPLTGAPASPLSADALWASAYKRYPEAKLIRAILPTSSADRSMEFDLLPKAASGSVRVWVERYTGEVLAAKTNSTRILAIAERLHGQLLMGSWASYLVELAASWALILVITGVCLWASQVKAHRPRLKDGSSSAKRSSKQRLRVWHRRIGVGLAIPLVLLILSGLPWTQLWGGNFASLKAQLGWAGPGQEWRITLSSSAPQWPDDADQQLWQLTPTEPEAVSMPKLADGSITLSDVAAMPEWQGVAPPVMILPPKPNNGVWSVRGLSQQRSQRLTVHFDQHTGEEIMRIRFEDHHPVQRFVSQGIALHEGALFGTLNQWLGLFTALGAVVLSSLGVFAWWKRRPAGRLVAPPPVPENLPVAWVGLCLILGVLLPTAGISMLVVLLGALLKAGLQCLHARKTLGSAV